MPKSGEEEEREWWEWGMGSYPYTSPKRSSWILRGYFDTGLLTYTMFGYFTPSGFPYTRSSPGTTFSYIYKSIRTDCRTWWPIEQEWGEWWEGSVKYYAYSRWYSEIPTPTLGSYTFYHDPTRGSAPVEPYNPNPDQ